MTYEDEDEDEDGFWFGIGLQALLGVVLEGLRLRACIYFR